MTVEEMVERIFWLGHDGFRIEARRTVYVDPFQISGGPTADLVLVTHVHYDHCSPEDIGKVTGPDTHIVTEKDSAAKLSGSVQVVTPGETVTVGDVTVEAVAAYNLDKQFHPRENGWLGFVIEIEGVRIYHAGDTDFIPEMKSIRTDIALLPVSGTYVMNADEAVQAAAAIAPRIAIPMHYGAIVGGPNDAQRFAAALEGKCTVKILEAE